MNFLCEERGANPIKRAVINTAGEATTVNERTFRLRPQDKFLRDNIRESDVLVASVGGNDVAMAIAALMGLVCLPSSCLEKGFVGRTVPVSVSDLTCWKS